MKRKLILSRSVETKTAVSGIQDNVEYYCGLFEETGSLNPEQIKDLKENVERLWVYGNAGSIYQWGRDVLRKCGAIKSSKQPIVSDMTMKQIEKYYKQGILTKREVVAVLMKENGWSFTEAKQIADYYEKLFSSRQITSRFYQNGNNNLYTLSEAAQYLSALFFDLRTIHFLTTGSEFYTYHELAQTLYEKTEEYYDDLIETAIGFDNDTSPMYVLPGDWDFVDKSGSLSTDGKVPQTLILDRLQTIYDILENVKQYDSMVQSKIDSMLEFYDKEIYKLKQALK